MTFRGLTVWNSNEGNQTGEESGNIDDNLGDDDSLLNCNVYIKVMGWIIFLPSSLTIVVVLDNFAPPGPIIVRWEALLGEAVLFLHLPILTAIYLKWAKNHLTNCGNL